VNKRILTEAEDNFILAELERITEQGLFRTERVLQARKGRQIKVDGKELTDFCSNDYLGLSCHPEVVKAMQTAASRFGAGSTASPMVSGKTSLHQALEERLAELTGRDRAVIFSCGYTANLGVVSALISSRKQMAIADRLCHASLVDAVLASRAVFRRFAHADPAALEAVLKRYPEQRKLVLTESVFSMDGDISPLPNLSQVCRNHNAILLADDAHGFGVIGENGLGGTDYFSLGQAAVPLLMATFGKALGVHGAFVAGPAGLLEMLVQKARPRIYSTSLPAPVIAAVDKALDVMIDEPERRIHLAGLIRRFHTGLLQMGISGGSPHSPIQPLVVGDPVKTLSLGRALEKEGFIAGTMRPPTVPRNTSRLRITLSAAHSVQQVDRLLEILGRLSVTGRKDFGREDHGH